MYYFDQFPGLEEIVLTDRDRLYLVQKQDLPNINCCNLSISMPRLVLQIQELFKDRGKLVLVSSYWFNRN
jgi:hypothetical protein